MRKAIVIKDSDNVATALAELTPRQVIFIDLPSGREEITVIDSIPFGHKFAIRRIFKGQPVIKYGEAIGIAVQDIEVGRTVHVHNLESQRGRGDLV